MKKICGIYKITSPKGRIYIGQSVDILTRLTRYKNLDCKHQALLYRSIVKYGYKNHKVEIIHECELSDLNKLEVYYIELYSCFNSKFGLNLREGGGAVGKFSEETKNKMRISHSGEKNHFYGKKHSDETKKRWSEIRTGRRLTQEHINKLVGIKHSEEAKFKRSLALKGRPSPMKGRKQSRQCVLKLSKPVLQFNMNGEFIKEWESAKVASLNLKINQSNIGYAAYGRRPSAGNFIWKFKQKNK